MEVYSPGNDAWILRQGKQMYVVETRTCEGFAKLDKEPDSGLGVLMGAFEMRQRVVHASGQGGATSTAPAPAPSESATEAAQN